MTDIMDLAKRRASTRNEYLSASAWNSVGLTPEQQIRQSALYKIREDAYLAADREYHAAIDQLSAEKLAELTREAS